MLQASLNCQGVQVDLSQQGLLLTCESRFVVHILKIMFGLVALSETHLGAATSPGT
jgi:hypothetical protein